MNPPSDDELDDFATRLLPHLEAYVDEHDRRNREGDVGPSYPVTHWRMAALCRTVDRDFFDIPSVGLAGQRTHMRIEIAICQECPSQNPCLDYAMDTRQPSGLWGGLLPKERSRLRQKQTRMANQLRKARG